MSLLRAAALPSDPPSSWLPSHVQVTVVRARGLRCKGKAGTSDAYAVIQLGRERYRTAVAEKSAGSAEWGEQCTFELPPELPGGAQSGLLLLFTVLHRALVGTDRFLGQAALPLEPTLRQGRGPDERWYKLHSKAGKKEKERGEILVSIQFTRNNLTASMFDLSMKDKPRSPFGKLKDKMKGKKKYDLESASAIIPSSMGALDMEDDYDLGGKKSKVKGFFLKNKLRKSSLTQSNTSLGSDSTISSASLSLATNVPEVTKSPSRHSSLSMERSVKDLLPSPKLTHKRAFSDDVSQVSPVLEPKAVQHLKPKNDPVTRSSLCINGSHVYGEEPVPKSSAGQLQSSVSNVPRRQEENFGFTPLHPDLHEVPWGLGSLEKTQQRDEPRFIPSPPSLALQEELKVSTKAVTLSNHLGRAKMEENSRLENKPTQAAAPMVLSTDTMKDKQPEETRKEDKKAKGGLFHHGGKGQGEKGGPSSVHTAAGGEERSKMSSWFSSKEPKESPQRPSFLSGPHPSTEVAGNFDSSEDCSPSASLRNKDPERESPAKSIVVPVPETTPPSSQGELPPPDEKPAVPPPLSEWDDTFDAFATSRLKPEPKKDNFFVSVASEGMAFIDDPDAASPTERSSEPAHEKGSKVLEEANSQMGSEMPSALRSWTNFSGLDVGANLVSTTQEATVIEDVLSPVSAGLAGRRRKSSTPTVWTTAFAAGNSGEKEASTPLTTDSSTREEGDSNAEEPSSPGTNGWMTIATETAPDPSESTQSGAEQEHEGLESAFGAFEAKSRSHTTTDMLTRSTFAPKLSPETLPGSNVVAVSPRVLADVTAQRFPSAPEPGMEPQGSEEEAFDIRTSVYRLQASMRLEASESRVRLGSDAHERHVVLAPWPGTQEREEMAVGSAVPPPKPPRWFAAGGSVGAGNEEDVCDLQPRQQRGSEEQKEDAESSKVDVELPRGHQSSDPSVPASPCPTMLRVDLAEARSEFPVSKDAESVDSAANLEGRAGKLAEGDTSVAENQAETDETDTAEQFVTCTSRFFLDGLGQSDAQGSRSQPGLSPAAGCEQGDVASEQMLCTEEQSVSVLNPPSKLDVGQLETFWTAVEEQEADDRPTDLSPAIQPQSPHPVKPISAAVQEVSSEKKQQHRSSLSSALSNGLEKLKTVTSSSVQPVAPSSHLEKTDSKMLKDPAALDQSAKYYHLTHDELIQLLLQREKELSKKEEHIHELENYIDQLLVRIMEQSPTLLQIPLEKSKAK